MRYEPPAHLVTVLRDLGLCDRRALRAVRARVRRLARDLPAFDQVWIDALVQARRITPFQAELLATQQGARLKLGPFVLIDRLGNSDLGETFLAQPAGRARRVALKVLHAHLVPAAEAQQRLEPVLSKLSSLKCRHLATPSSWGVAQGHFYLASPWVCGPNGAEILMHAGRLAPAAVAEMARQLLTALGCLWAQGMAHGDLRPSHVRLASNGKAMLTDPAIRPALPQASLLGTRAFPPQRFDYLSPESFEIGQASNPASDQYALGCLLWHLLGGRPALPGADAEAKRLARQRADVPDVRAIAPATPAPLAELIAALTRRDPAERPREGAPLLRKLGPPSAAGRSQLARLAKALGRRWRHQKRARRRGSLLAVSASAATIALLAASMLMQHSLGDALVELAQGRRDPRSQPGPSATSVMRVSGTAALPVSAAAATADRDEHVVVLTQQVYRVQGDYLKPPRQPGRRLALQPGQRILGDQRPVLILDDGPLRVTAPDMQWENVRFLLARTAGQATAEPQPLIVVSAAGCRFRRCSFELQDARRWPSALVVVDGGEATFEDCLFEGPSAPTPAEARQRPAAVVWQSTRNNVTVPHQAPQGVQLSGCDVQRLSAAVEATADAAPRIQLRQCVLRESGVLVRIIVLGESRGPVAIQLSGCATYDADAVLEVGYRRVPDGWPGCALQADDCQFHFEALGGDTGRGGALVSFRGAKPDGAMLRKIHWSGTGSAVISPADVPEAVWNRAEESVPLNRSLAIEGLGRGRSAPRRAGQPGEVP